MKASYIVREARQKKNSCSNDGMIDIPYYDEHHNRLMATNVLQRGDGSISWKMCYGLSNTSSSKKFVLTDEHIGLIVRYPGSTNVAYWSNESSIVLSALSVCWFDNSVSDPSLQTNAVKIPISSDPLQMNFSSPNSWVLVFILPWYENS